MNLEGGAQWTSGSGLGSVKVSFGPSGIRGVTLIGRDGLTELGRCHAVRRVCHAQLLQQNGYE